MQRDELEALLEKVIDGHLSIRKAVTLLLDDMGRGGRILVVDENLAGLEAELAHLNYTSYLVDLSEEDDWIKKQLRGRILVTRNGRDFVADVAKFRYGLIWITSKGDNRTLARKVEKAYSGKGFKKNVAQVVKV